MDNIIEILYQILGLVYTPTLPGDNVLNHITENQAFNTEDLRKMIFENGL